MYWCVVIRVRLKQEVGESLPTTSKPPEREPSRQDASCCADRTALGFSFISSSSRQTYESSVLLRLELQMLASADVFSGTFSSNMGRVVALMRHTLRKPKESTLSIDGRRWHPA